MSAIKKFFEKKKLNSKFKLAGSGQQLNAPSAKPAKTPSRTVERCPTNAVGARAGNAALARFEAQQSESSKMPTSSATTWKQKAGSNDADSLSEIGGYGDYSDAKKPRSVPVEDGVLFCCPLCPVILPREEIYMHLNQCFMHELDAEPLMISVTMIYTLNRDKQKVDNCINVVSKYLQNIINNPCEVKYRKIRKTNKIFQEKVANIVGISEYLTNGCGFQMQKLPFEVGGAMSEHEFYVMSESLAQDTEQLLAAKQMLMDAEPLDISIDRNVKVFKPSTSAMHIEVPSSFYEMSSTDIKQKQAEMESELEKSKQLRTKAMREADAPPKHIYKYCIIRIRLPDGVLLQGTFSSSERLIDLRKFIQEHLFMDWIPFTLVDSIGRPYLEESATLTKLKLSPASLVNFNIEPNISEEIAASSQGHIQYLRDEYMALIQSLDTR